MLPVVLYGGGIGVSPLLGVAGPINAVGGAVGVADE